MHHMIVQVRGHVQCHAPSSNQVGLYTTAVVVLSSALATLASQGAGTVVLG